MVLLFSLDADVFADNWSGAVRDLGDLFDQVRGTMLATVFVFLGVEGASVYSRHAKRREDVGRATVLGLPQRPRRLRLGDDSCRTASCRWPRSPSCASRRWRASWRPPSATWGKVFVSVGLIVSVLGAYLAWTLMAAEVLFVAAKDDDMPRFLGRTTRDDVPGPGPADDHDPQSSRAGRHAVLRRRVQLRLDLTSALS